MVIIRTVIEADMGVIVVVLLRICVSILLVLLDVMLASLAVIGLVLLAELALEVL